MSQHYDKKQLAEVERKVRESQRQGLKETNAGMSAMVPLGKLHHELAAALGVTLDKDKGRNK